MTSEPLEDLTSAEPGTEPEPDANSGAGPEVDSVPVPLPTVQMRFVDVVVVLPSTNPVVVLEEIDPPARQLRIPIGTPEGVAIAYAARGIPTPKPLTHELFLSVLEAFGICLEYVRITGAQENAFTAEIVVSGPKGSRTLPCRPSDGIALALRQRLAVPIVIVRDVLDAVASPATGPVS